MLKWALAGDLSGEGYVATTLIKKYPSLLSEGRDAALFVVCSHSLQSGWSESCLFIHPRQETSLTTAINSHSKRLEMPPTH